MVPNYLGRVTDLGSASIGWGRNGESHLIAANSSTLLRGTLPLALDKPLAKESRSAPLIPGQDHAAGERPRLHQVQVHPACQRGEERRAAAHEDRMGDDLV